MKSACAFFLLPRSNASSSEQAVNEQDMYRHWHKGPGVKWSDEFPQSTAYPEGAQSKQIPYSIALSRKLADCVNQGGLVNGPRDCMRACTVSNCDECERDVNRCVDCTDKYGEIGGECKPCSDGDCLTCDGDESQCTQCHQKRLIGNECLDCSDSRCISCVDQECTSACPAGLQRQFGASPQETSCVQITTTSAQAVSSANGADGSSDFVEFASTDGFVEFTTTTTATSTQTMSRATADLYVSRTTADFYEFIDAAGGEVHCHATLIACIVAARLLVL